MFIKSHDQWSSDITFDRGNDTQQNYICLLQSQYKFISYHCYNFTGEDWQLGYIHGIHWAKICRLVITLIDFFSHSANGRPAE